MEKQSKTFSKKFIWIASIAAILIVGASVAAATIFNKNPKEQFFSAEVNSLNFMKDAVEERYNDELDWVEATKEKPSETTMELSAEFNDPSGFDSTGMQEFINSSTITLTNGFDPKNKKMTLEAKASMAGISLEDIKFFLSSDNVMLSLPFLEKVIEVKESDLPDLITQFDPTGATAVEEFEFDRFFNQKLMSEEDIKHIQETYVQMIYKELPEDAFSAEDDTVDVDGEQVEATKLSLQLSEQQLKDIIEKVLTALENDERLKEYLKEQMALDPAIAGTYTSEDMAQLINDFDTGIAEAKKELKDLQIPNGLTATVWTENDLIVKRDFSIEMAPAGEELVTFTIAGTQLLEKETQVFDYELGFDDGTEADSLTLTGDLSWKDGKADDSITVSAAGVELSYTGAEQVNDGTREFDRQFAFNDSALPSAFQLNWNGSSTYDNDQMNSTHNFSVVGEGISEDIFQLNVSNDAELVKSIEFDTGSKEVLDLGSMSQEEIQMYIMEEAGPQLEQWMTLFNAGY
ncbi:DUF6583 family protein [Aquibacillus rhizosphaerae]|uniref:DUF945 family protein n=1 Tax=Aquibacillus rhizosphaerae TaxID=3051431 RepID=A0ABT7LA76_9BACI|nr:DUF6583 family protein [Aquibacillus sp. LR5S19]MDL4842090.1 hypothetical protein [Aquibacillus sp. LR5S19]